MRHDDALCRFDLHHISYAGMHNTTSGWNIGKGIIIHKSIILPPHELTKAGGFPIWGVTEHLSRQPLREGAH